MRDIKLTPAQAARVAAAESGIQPTTERHHYSGCKQARRNESPTKRRAGQSRFTATALHVAGCMLYWAEGERTRNAVAIHQFGSRDGAFLRVSFYKTYFDAAGRRDQNHVQPVRGSVERQREIEQLLARCRATVDTCHFASRTVNVYSKYSKKKRINKLPYGTVRVTVCRTRVVQSIFGAIQEYAGFEREAWLE